MSHSAPLDYEQPFWTAKRQVVGIDEVGRGALAGPVTVAAVVLTPGVAIAGVNDSKTLTASRRDVLSATIYRDALAIGIGDASAAEIDAGGLTAALQLAAQRALAQLTIPVDAILLDGRHDFLRAAIPTQMIVKGDKASQSIAAASIVAKVHRDALMVVADARYPLYGFAGHKGYGSQAHRDAIGVHGVCLLHRRSFAPCSGHEQLGLLPTG